MKVITFWESFYDTNVFYSAMGTLCRGSLVRFHSGDLHLRMNQEYGSWEGVGMDGQKILRLCVCLCVSVSVTIYP